MDKSYDLSDGSVYVALVTSTYIPDAANHTVWTDITGESSGTGYTTGGKVVANPTLTQDDGDNEGVFDGDDVSWTSSTVNAKGAVVYYNTGSKPLICYIDFGAVYTSANNTFKITWNSEGIVNIG